ncbi:MAG: class II aldolase/adducin family protein [Bacteroidota bacterium]
MAVKNPIEAPPGLYPTFETVEAERLHLKQRLAGAFRIFGRFGFSEGVAGHITVRDPEREDCFWVNPFGLSFNRMTASDLILVDHEGNIVEGKHKQLNQAAFAIHSRVHAARPDCTAAAHAHSVYGKAWSATGALLDPLTQDSCAFYEDHSIYSEYTGVVLDTSEGDRIGAALGQNKAVILQNHGLLTVGKTVEEAAWWFITMERSCQAQMMAEATGRDLIKIDHETALNTRNNEVGFPIAGHFSFQPLWQDIVTAYPELMT